ncbi:MAG: OsmC family protein [Thermoanaerobaculia bacterium]|jgi:putative redox protein
MRFVNAVLQRSFRTELTIGPHTIIADEPVEAGGQDEGPTPYDLLGSALATCTAMTLQFYAKREKIALERVEVSVSNERIHARDCTDCESESGFAHRFDVKLRVSGDLTEAQREKLLEIARRCPVNKTLSREIKIFETLEGC